MVKLVQNERSWAIDLIGYINRILEKRGFHIKLAGGETTINNREDNSKDTRKIMFPDVLLYEDVSKSNVIQGWEIKLPDVSITDQVYIQDAQQKADVLGLNSTILWNFKNVALYVKSMEGEWELYYQWNELDHIRTREDVGRYQQDWLKLLETVLAQLNEFFMNGTIQTTKIELILSKSLMANILKQNKAVVADHIKEVTTRNRIINIHLKEWWREVEVEYKNDELSMYSAFSKVIISNWIIKITFAHLIKYYHNSAKAVEQIKFNMNVEEANEIFNKITRECDFYTIFCPIQYNDLIPSSFWRDLTDYNAFLTEQGISRMSQETLQVLLEDSVRDMRREVIGQFTTPVLLSELLVNSTIQDTSIDVIDPCSGSGTIAKAVLDLKKRYIDERSAHETVWASDKYEYPLQLSNLALTDISSINIANRVFQSNVFNIVPGKTISLTEPMTGESKEYEIPRFGAVVSNLPFVSFEAITADEKKYLLEIKEEVYSSLGIKLSKRSDLYTYIVLYLWRMLDEKGRLGLVLSNSWLGTMSGREFYEVIRKLYHVEYVLISGNKRWFQNAEVVTTMLILTKKESIETACDTRFGILHCSLEKLSEQSILDQVSNHILANTKVDSTLLTTTTYSQRVINQLLDFKISINALFHSIEWLNDVKVVLVPLSQEFKVIRGMRRGWDAMFYPEEGHGIESEYIQRVLKSSRSVKGLIAYTDSDAFCCSDSLEEIREKDNVGAYNWITKFSKQLNKVGKPLPEVLQKSAGKNEYWHEMNTKSQAEIVTTMNPGRRLFYSKLDNKGFINQRLIGLSRVSKSSNLDLNHALLNSLVGMFFIEAVGFGRGLGALDLNATAIANTLMLNPKLVTGESEEQILIAFEQLKRRDVLPFKEEIKQEDRILFEKVVLESYGLSHLFEPIRDSIISMQKVRQAALSY